MDKQAPPQSSGQPSEQPPEQRRYWLDAPRNVDRVVKGVYVLCALATAIELLDGWLGFKHQIHPAFAQTVGFYGVFGFVCYVGAVLAGKSLRRLLMRPEDYYDE